MQNSILQWLASKLLERTLQPRELLTARKAVYIFLVVVLFTASFFWRRAAVDARAVELAIRQDSRGEVELSGELVRLSLTGSRGIVTCVLWVEAIEKQKKNQWNELELLVRALTKLQPHFITPWLFQSWNLSYNVSVESDRVNDKYFYITRGIDLLAEGERQNKNHPDLRFSTGFYLQHKIMQSDQTNALRSLFQLSLIPPSERDPDRFLQRGKDDREEINWVEFEKFITKYPQLARRLHSGQLRDNLREHLNQFTCRDAEEVVRFLRDNWRVPGSYELPEKKPGVAVEAKDVLLPPESRFPPLPPPRPNPYKPAGDIFTELTSDSTLDDTVDGFAVSRAWFGYAQEPLPSPGPLPGSSVDITDRVHQRKPRHMTTLLFRAYPALTMSSGADRLEQEGWFAPDEEEEKRAEAEKRTAEEYWEFPEDSWFKARGNTFTDPKTGKPLLDPRTGKPVKARLVLQNSQHADKTWDIAARMVTRHGEMNHLLFEDARTEAQLYQDALAYCQSANIPVGTHLPPPQEGPGALTGERLKQYQAARYMGEYKSYRDMSNFAHHYYRAKIESLKVAIAARKLFHQAESAYLRGNLVKARETYENPNALAAWREEVLLGWGRTDLLPAAGVLAGPLANDKLLSPAFRRALMQFYLKPGSDPIAHRTYRNDVLAQEFAYETQIHYMQFFTEQYGVRMQKAIAQTAGKTTLPAMPLPAGAGAAYALHCLLPVLVENDWTPPPIRRIYADLRGPFDILVFDPYALERTSLEEVEKPSFAGGGLFGTLGGWSKPLITAHTITKVRERKGLYAPPKTAPAADQTGKKP